MKITHAIGATVLAGALGVTAIVISPGAANADPPPPSPPEQPTAPAPGPGKDGPPGPLLGGALPGPLLGGPLPGPQLPAAAQSMLDPASLAFLSGLLPLMPRGEPQPGG